MKKSQQLQLSISEARERLSKVVEKRNAVAPGQPVSADILKEMDSASKAIQPLEIEYRAAAIQEDNDEKKQKSLSPDSQEIEKRELVSKASIVPFLLEAVENSRPLDGVEHEARQALLGDDARTGLIPFEMLLHDEKGIEERADTATPLASAAVTPGGQADILQRVFSQSVANRLLVSMPMVDVGESNFPVLLTGTSASMAAPGAAVDATAGSFTGFNLEPIRLQARYLFRQEDVYKLRGIEDSLRRDLVSLLSDKLDDQIINGNGTAPQVNGFISELPTVTDPLAVTTWAQYIANFTGLVDGLNAYSLNDIRSIIGSKTFVYGETLYRTTQSDISAQRLMEERTGGVSVSSRMGTANIQTNLAALTSYPGANAVAPIWRAIEVLRDPYTNAGTGEISLTATMFFNFKLVRETGFKLFKVRTA